MHRPFSEMATSPTPSLAALNDGTANNGKALDATVQPCPLTHWIRITVMDDDSKQPVDGIQVDMNLPGKNKVNQATGGGQPCFWDKLPAGSGKLEKMSDANQVWEMLRIESV